MPLLDVKSPPFNSADLLDPTQTVLPSEFDLPQGPSQLDRLAVARPDETCCDCNAKRPDWCSISRGCLLCIECSGAHRRLGVSVTVVRSLTLDQLDDETMQFLCGTSNAAINRYYEYALRDDARPLLQSVDQRLSFARRKYVEREWTPPAGTSGAPDPPPTFARYPVRTVSRQRVRTRKSKKKSDVK